LSGCGVTSLIVPVVGIPTTNYFTREYYKDKYVAYDAKYRESHSFLEHQIPHGVHKLYVRDFGDSNTNKKPVIILLHGFPDSLHIYDQLAPKLASQYRVISFDFLGWGNSDKPENHVYNSVSLYHDLEAVIKYFNFEKISLVVHDASGPPGIEWAMNNSEKMDTLILLNTYYHPMIELLTPETIKTFSTPGIKRTIIRTGAKVSNIGWKIGFQNQLNKFFYDKKQGDIMIPVLTHQAMNIRKSFFQLNDVLNQEAKLRLNKKRKLFSYTGKVKIIFGKEDPYLNSKVAIKFNEIFKNSTLNLINHAAHFVQLDQPVEVSNLILNKYLVVNNIQ
ncbi:MAG: alpha/beta hydrolase, partial [Gammaproteobacteria bacterium]|nr:alpha/beta hydrolase [Gammaproteobacteria bacterium]